LINASDKDNENNPNHEIDDNFYQDTEREQGAPGQDFADLTEPLSEIQSEIQLNLPQNQGNGLKNVEGF
jgi:hypothetical protein